MRQPKTLERRISYCRKCKDHGLRIPLKGHADVCPFHLCKCAKCGTLYGQRIKSLIQRSRERFEVDVTHTNESSVKETEANTIDSDHTLAVMDQSQSTSPKQFPTVQKQADIVLRANDIFIQYSNFTRLCQSIVIALAPAQVPNYSAIAPYASLCDEHILANILPQKITTAQLLHHLEKQYFEQQFQL
ncbi:DM DNA binding domain-containing protein [Ditylenchus destructor]|uniref:DM DNA binding domain-containing protein n=1 Tax=Ditylenchus destructor TaxID=166010 RepID=A0AAD4MVU8_9BILA|nr:DM DNA binding domain-containing protein [Ditylenchus destructor]